MATRSILIRSGDARDIAQVEALMLAAFDPRYGEAWTRGQCLGVIAMPGVRLTLAQVDDDAAGFALVRTIADEAELLLLAVDPRFRRRGIASALLKAVTLEAQSAGIAAFHLEVRAGNEAVRLYVAQGFAKVGERRGYYRGKTGQVHDAHTYRKAIG